MGPHKEDGVSPRRLPGKICKAVNRDTASPVEVWAMLLPVLGAGEEGVGDREYSDLYPSEAEHGRAIYCDAANSGILRGGSETAGGTCPKEMVGADED